MDQLIREGLSTPADAVAYTISQRLADLYPARAIIEGDDTSFDLEAYAAAGHCSLQPKPLVHSQVLTEWNGPRQGLSSRAANAWFEVAWRGHPLDVLLMSWGDSRSPSCYYWILADQRAIAEQFLLTVCEWGAEARGEILVFDAGCWQKSQELFRAIQDATFDNLVLRGSLKRQLQDDLPQFFASRDIYEEYRVPWKRGILFIGPPGNGKTHAVKAIVNSLKQPCLYVKSFRAEGRTDHDNTREVFRRARQTAPCLLILEDLDALVDEQNRAFFLNELDGFASNTGIVTLATTNHPERLDPAILNRPSRFDRKYFFDLPNLAERQLYTAMWNDALQPELRLTEPAIAQIVELTEGFSFAYLKELFLSSTMRWIAWPEPDGLQTILVAQAMALREQMRSTSEESVEEAPAEERNTAPFDRGGKGQRRAPVTVRRGTGRP
jgi:AAA+ superfamily predicted ATPase